MKLNITLCKWQPTFFMALNCIRVAMLGKKIPCSPVVQERITHAHKPNLGADMTYLATRASIELKPDCIASTAYATVV